MRIFLVTPLDHTPQINVHISWNQNALMSSNTTMKGVYLRAQKTYLNVGDRSRVHRLRKRLCTTFSRQVVLAVHNKWFFERLFIDSEDSHRSFFIAIELNYLLLDRIDRKNDGKNRTSALAVVTFALHCFWATLFNELNFLHSVRSVVRWYAQWWFQWCRKRLKFVVFG